jgi:hypothetical protein
MVVELFTMVFVLLTTWNQLTHLEDIKNIVHDTCLTYKLIAPLEGESTLRWST